MKKNQPVIGQKGVKYGLQVRKPGGGLASAPAGPKPPSVFGGDSDSEEETVGAQVQRQAYAKKADTKVTQRIVHGAALGCGRAR
jgi:hypothetical protein